MTDDVFDLDALAAEARGEPFRFRFGGDDYEMPPNVDIRAALAANEGRILDAFSILLGAEQWQRMLDSESTLDSDLFDKLMQAYYAHIGTSVGESRASSSSSKSTAGPSRRTSKRSTTVR